MLEFSKMLSDDFDRLRYDSPCRSH